ncbi:T9SS type A sorting domain-containing protein [Lutibacter sp.]|uniref:T9SS type A sorting domain-containing protein n=1 Tax=Lutibacter sp. TaxID=1925666 RepID=UPI0025C6C083|nr:T9SS type A sorting domain-containing protein [Lutibacter sp.]MCF6168622.1 T9SS type A sorting domain-containing protein [Lutibacter sp.]
MKKLLLITFLLIFSFSFAQQNGKSSVVVSKNEPLPTLSSVSAYPNPFRSTTRINFRSTKNQLIEFSLKNLLGKTVYLEQINSKIGYNTIPFNRANLTKGMYIYTLQTEREIISKRLIIR